MRVNRRLFIVSVGICFALLLLIYRKLVLNPSTHLVDFRDYPFCIWVIYQNISHFSNLSFHSFFESNVFYPFKSTLLFSEMFLPVSMLAWPLSWVISNPILVFNILFFITLLLDVLSAHLLWGRLFKSKLEIFFASLLTVASPFVFQNSPHFQSLSYWPILIALSLLLKSSRTRRDTILVGIFLTIQFLSNTYLGIFSLFVVGLWFLIEIISQYRSGRDVGVTFFHTIHCFLTFLLTCGFFIWKYVSVKHAYQITRDFGEYVTNSSQISDYFFSTHFNSLVTRFKPVAHWNARNVHGSMFPSFSVIFLATIGMFEVVRTKLRTVVGFEINKERLFFLCLVVGGFVASLGPRLVINNVFVGLPLPYALALKVMPFLMSIRVTERWAFLFFLGLAYFAALGISKIGGRRKVLVVFLATFIYLMEVMPLSMPVETKNYYPSVYSVISQQCQKRSQVLLEYPFEQDKGYEANILTNLTYRTQYMLASIKHKCLLVNGYSGYFPQDFHRYQNEMGLSIVAENEQSFLGLLKQRDVRLFKLNKKDIYSAKAKLIEEWLLRKEGVAILSNDNDFLIVQL